MGTLEELHQYLATWNYFQENVWKLFFREEEGNFGNIRGDLNDIDTNKWNRIKQGVKKAEDKVASYPIIKNIIIPYMVDVCGNTSDVCNESIEKVLEDFDFKDFLERCGSIPSMLQQSIKFWGFKITDRGAGCESWHLGVPCTETQANELCSLLHKNFNFLILKGYITIYKHFWGFSLPELYNWNKNRIYVKKNGFDKKLYNKLIDEYEVNLEKV